jgi:hypothetical protein
MMNYSILEMHQQNGDSQSKLGKDNMLVGPIVKSPVKSYTRL